MQTSKSTAANVRTSTTIGRYTTIVPRGFTLSRMLQSTAGPDGALHMTNTLRPVCPMGPKNFFGVLSWSLAP